MYDLFNPRVPKVFRTESLSALFYRIRRVFISGVRSRHCWAFRRSRRQVRRSGNRFDHNTIRLELTFSCGLSCEVGPVSVHYSDTVWNLFGVFRADFLAVDPCRKRAGILHETRARSSRFVVAYTRIALLLIQQWGHFLRTSSLDSKARITDWWTLTVSDTQQIDGRVQRVLCFVLHTGVPLIAIHLGVCFFLSGVMSIFFSWMIIVQHGVLAGSFQGIGHGKDEQTSRFRPWVLHRFYDANQGETKIVFFTLKKMCTLNPIVLNPKRRKIINNHFFFF